MEITTDRRTSDKSSWWSITAFNEDKDRLVRCMDGQEVMPNWVKRIYGGLEMCPSTEKEHFQGAINTSHVRFSQLKGWLSGTHIEMRKGTKKQLIAYVMKEETAVGVKTVKSNPKYLSMDEALMKMSDYLVNKYDPSCYDDYIGMSINGLGITINEDNGYDHLSCRVMKECGLSLVSLYSQPQMERAWKKYYRLFISESQKKLGICP